MTNLDKKKIVDYYKTILPKPSLMILKYLLYQMNLSNKFIPINQTDVGRRIGISQTAANRAFGDLIVDKVLIRGEKERLISFKLNEFTCRRIGVNLR